MSVLDEIVAATRDRLRDLPAGEPARRPALGAFENALRGRDRLAVIAEMKRKSPSRGALSPHADALEQARAYHRCGAAAVSVLCEPTRFGGSFEDLEEVAAGVPVPVLMKDFVIDPEQVRVAALLGAAASLVMVRLLPGRALGEILSACSQYAVEPLVECHDAEEVGRAVEHGARVIGINNRDLASLEVDRERALILSRGVPAETVVVAESGYRTPEDTLPIRGRFDAVLIGSALMQAPDVGRFLRGVTACE